MSLPPILYHYFRAPVPYTRGLALQEAIHKIQHTQKKNGTLKDVLLLLQHRPVYTAGRRQTEDSTRNERLRLEKIGADFITATRGGELTYHGPGQLVGYPLLDLSRYTPTMGARDYVCRMEKLLKRHLKDGHGIDAARSEHTGVFLDATSKIASIGVQIRHRLTSHGFAMNITREPQAWFDQIVACGLVGVNAVSIESATNKPVSVEGEIPGLVKRFEELYDRDLVPLDVNQEGEIGSLVADTEEASVLAGSWPEAPIDIRN
jgi:lipoyl(octanoyl) transferase 2